MNSGVYENAWCMLGFKACKVVLRLAQGQRCQFQSGEC